MRTWRGLPLVLLLTASCSANVLTPNEELLVEVEELKKRVLELQRKATVSEVEVQRLRQEVALLEARLEEGTRSPVDREARRPQSRRPVSLEMRRAAPDSGIEEDDLEDAELVAAPPGEPSEPELEEEATLRLSPAAQALYDRGYTLYHQNRYLDAETSFQRFLLAYPDSELADNAQYWIGECRYARRDFSGALAAFRETLSRYPDGNKIPDALLKSGQTLESLGDRDGARRSYREVTRRFPNTAAAALAEEFLANLS